MEMGSSGSGCAADCGVGSVVWVRRRNGSWWPGKILGPDELSASHLTSPRTGTPVKLLGREDASVDWYNLEKSKRVKPFRCGEFDDSIEKVESSLGMPMKKREKYARREDAILHALELERELLKKEGKLSDHMSSKTSHIMKKELDMLSERLENESGKLRSFKPQKIRGNNQLSCKDGPSDVLPRMRGLQDFGLRTAPAKRKFSSFIVSNGSWMVDNNAQNLCSGFSLRNSSYANAQYQVRKTSISAAECGAASIFSGMEHVGDAFQTSKNRSMYLPTDSSDSLDSKDMPLRLTEMAPLHCREDNNPNQGSLVELTPEYVEDFQSDSSGSDSDSTETEPDTDGGMSLHSDVSVPLEAEANAQRRPDSQLQEERVSSEELGSAPSGETSNHYPHDLISVNEAVSKWQLKGKRKVRTLTRKPLAAAERSTPFGSHNAATPFSQRILGQNYSFLRNDSFIHNVGEAYTNPRDFGSQKSGFENRDYLFTPRTASEHRNPFGRDLIDWDLAWGDRAATRGNWENRRNFFNSVYLGHHRFGGRMRSILIDVDLTVQGAGYKRESVGFTSLISKVNGNAIVGHPIQIGLLEDGSTDALLQNDDGFGYELIGFDRSATVPPAWKTSRRTANSRVPRPRVSAFDDDEYSEELSISDQEMPVPFGRSFSGSCIEKASLMRKSYQNIPSSLRKTSRKLPKKASIPSGQKTRTLHSIAMDHQKVGNKRIHGSSNGQMDGLIKPDSSGPTTVACIPLKLVFSRLVEKINRPLSKPSGNTDRKLP